MTYGKKTLVAIPPKMLEEIDYIARTEHRTRSDLIREALRRYAENFRLSGPTTRGSAFLHVVQEHKGQDGV